MSTNYYMIQKAGKNIVVREHIGKRAAGSFVFSSYGSSPWGELISWSQWRRVIEHVINSFNNGRTINTYIRDEYNHYLPNEDLRELIDYIDNIPMQRRSLQYDAVMASPYTSKDRDHLDSEGYSFTTVEFA